MATKYVKATMVMKFLYKDHKVFQYFIVAEPKLKKYVLSDKFLLHKRLEDFIEKNALSVLDERYTFLNRRDEEDRITLEFSYTDEVDRRSTGYFALVGDVPYNEGCEECKFRDCTYCTKKDKEIEKMLKSCKYFIQSQESVDENRTQ